MKIALFGYLPHLAPLFVFLACWLVGGFLNQNKTYVLLMVFGLALVDKGLEKIIS